MNHRRLHRARLRSAYLHLFVLLILLPAFLPLPLRVILRVPGLRNLPGRVAAFGVRRVRLQRPEEMPYPMPVSGSACSRGIAW